MTTNPEPIGVPVIVLDQTKTKVLLGKRKNSYKSGSYGVPGGRIELTEPLIEAAKRELKEETGLEAKTLTYIGVIRDFQQTYTFIHFAFLCTDYSGEPKNTEPDKCEGWEWYELTNLPQPLLRGHQAAIDLYLKHESLKDLL